MHRPLRLGSGLLLLALSSHTAHAQPDPRGLYVYSWEVAIDTDPTKPHTALGIEALLSALNTPGIDGLTLVLDWRSIQTSPETDAPATFAWTTSPPVLQNGELVGTTSMDKWIQQAIAAGKHINLAIRSGAATPCWLFTAATAPTACSGYNGPYAGATAILPPGQTSGPSFYVSAHQGRGICTPETLAAPWDPAFLHQWRIMLTNLSTYLHSVSFQGVTEYDAITMVRLTGINRTTDEFRLPAEVLTQCAGGVGNGDAVMTWLSAGYRPSLIFTAWDHITDAFLQSFGDKWVNVPLIATNSGTKKNKAAGNGQFPFPPIDENGCVYLAGIPTAAQPTYADLCHWNFTVTVPDQNLDLVALASRKFPGKLTVEVENLLFKLDVATGQGSPVAAHSIVTDYAQRLGAMPAYMTNNYFGPFPKNPGGTSCGPLSNLVRCFPVYYGEMLTSGIVPDAPQDPFMRSQFIEVFFPDVFFPDASGRNTECDEAPPATGQPPAYPPTPPDCAYPEEILQGHAALLEPPLVTMTFPPANSTTHWLTTLPVIGVVQASSAVGQPITTLDCTGAASGSGAGGFALRVRKAGGPAIVTCRATDAAGHLGETIYPLWIDTRPPVTTPSVNRAPDGATTVTLSAQDDFSGVAYTQYRIDGGPWTSGTVVPLGEGTHQLGYRSTDVAGNVELPKSITVTVVITPPCHGSCGP